MLYGDYLSHELSMIFQYLSFLYIFAFFYILFLYTFTSQSQYYLMQPTKQPLSQSDSLYMRYHVTLQKAMNFVRQVYKDQLIPGTQETRFNYAIKIAGMTQQLNNQDYLDYHMSWLVGLLNGIYDSNPDIYQQQITNILNYLPDYQSQRVLRYIQQVNYNRKLAKGEQFKQMLDRVNEMDMVPCYIRIYMFYTLCHLWRNQKNKHAKEDYEAFMSYAYLFWYRAVSKFFVIAKNIKPYIKDFFKEVEVEMGGDMKIIRQKAIVIFNRV